MIGTKATQTAAQALGISIQQFSARNVDELEGAFPAIVRERIGAVVVQPSSWFFAARERLAQLAIKNRLVTMSGGREYAEGGCLVSYRADLAFGFRRAADFVDKILKGAKPGDLPMEQPTR